MWEPGDIIKLTSITFNAESFCILIQEKTGVPDQYIILDLTTGMIHKWYLGYPSSVWTYEKLA